MGPRVEPALDQGTEPQELPACSGDAYDATRTEFARSYPAIDADTEMSRLRSQEFARLDATRHVYLDYTGGGLYGESQIRQHGQWLLTSVLGNPHSTNPTSLAATDRVEHCRKRVLEFFNADPDEYGVIFTANASQALKLVGESYPFEPGDRFLLTFDNHNSVNGIREFDRAHGATTTYVPVRPPEMRVQEDELVGFLRRSEKGRNNLFAYPAQSNFSGVQHPLEWVALAQEYGWDVLLDAAAFVPTNQLDLARVHPEYVALSFYKMFGYPTGVGALIARWSALEKLHRPWFAGGTIEVASVQADAHVPAGGAAAFEDGTLDYANLPAVDIGLDFLERIGIDTIHDRVHALTAWLLNELLALRYSNRQPLVLVYGPTDMTMRGGAIAVNFLAEDGRVIDHQAIEEEANRFNISLRTGCFCNPGAGEIALGLDRSELVTCFSTGERMTFDDFRRCIDGKSTGAVRISLGLASNFSDVYTFVQFAKRFVEPSAPS